ncbi:MAG: energy transducer TonB [Lewinella sp.]|nr:energy transducer TonB [Lewinella sp.]
MLLMNLSGTEVLLAGGSLVLGLLLLTAALRRRFRRTRETRTSGLDRTKYLQTDVHRFRMTFWRLGLVTALALATLAFSWTTYDLRPMVITVGEVETELIDMAPPITEHRPPPPPPPPQIMTVDNSVILEDTTVFQSMDIQAQAAVAPQPAVIAKPATPAYIPPPPPREDNVPPFFKVVEDMPYFGECQHEADKDLRKQCSDRALIDFMSRQLKYPVLAQESNVSGTAVVRFIVETDGSLTDIEVVRDPGAGLGAEARRVVELMAEQGGWTPGRQQGRPVRVQFNLPVRFQLR